MRGGVTNATRGKHGSVTKRQIIRRDTVIRQLTMNLITSSDYKIQTIGDFSDISAG